MKSWAELNERGLKTLSRNKKLTEFEDDPLLMIHNEMELSLTFKNNVMRSRVALFALTH